MVELAQFIQGLPKAELHLHIEGTLEPELCMALAARNKVELRFRSIEELRAAYRFRNLQDFLDLYYQNTGALRQARDFYDLTRAYLDRAHRQSVRHAEIFFDPQAHTRRGIEFPQVIDGIQRACDDARRECGISTRLILCFLRDLSAESAMDALEQALPHKGRIVGVGLDSAEVGHPPAKFKDVFARARREGFRVVAHAGEEGPPAYVWGALDELEVARIDHGVRSLEDDALVKRLAADQVPLTVCPLSNLRLHVVSALAEHPLKRMLAAGLVVTVNSDDPAYF
ncbi:MAG: adenosine deaminase, partial [Alphaproteobacteria bacterium]|nr:adenosine deaminase [Alphaproteobacteria bacterium]